MHAGTLARVRVLPHRDCMGHLYHAQSNDSPTCPQPLVIGNSATGRIHHKGLLMRAPGWRLVGTSLFSACIIGSCGRTAPAALSSADSAAIAGVQEAYVRAWLADDTAGVLATLEADAILLPPGREPVVGQEAIRAHWWPTDGSTTRITGFTLETAEVLGGGGVAVARGLSTVSWRYQKDTVRSEQTVQNISLSVLRRSPAGDWRIARQMWGPALR